MIMKEKIKGLWAKWLVISEKIGDFISYIVITVFYFTLFLIPSLYFTYCSDKMGKKIESHSYFQDVPDIKTQEELEEM